MHTDKLMTGASAREASMSHPACMQYRPRISKTIFFVGIWHSFIRVLPWQAVSDEYASAKQATLDSACITLGLCLGTLHLCALEISHEHCHPVSAVASRPPTKARPHYVASRQPARPRILTKSFGSE
eukprot:1161869-Pelagomonas_calceolata.AAC.4